MRYEFASNMAPHIIGLLEQKHALGFPYVNSELILANFDRYCQEYYPDEQQLTREVCLTWGAIREGEGSQSLRNRLAPLRELARYMIHNDEMAYLIPDELIPRKGARPTPHIFSDEELGAFFEATDCLAPSARCRAKHLVVPVIFRVMYCCGLRPNEALSIRNADLDMGTGRLTIPESKGHRGRIVMLADDVLELCQKYTNALKREVIGNPWLFPTVLNYNRCYERSWLPKTFAACWEASGLKKPRNQIRPYNFRHTFATNRIYYWMKEGRDVEAYLPYLSAYMGHTKLSHTAYYIHLVPKVFPQLASQVLDGFECLIPEVDDYEG
jgi:integrase